MKICPGCQKTYDDDNLNFCLEDGSVLNQMSGGGALPETVLMNQARLTDPNKPFGSQPEWTGSQQPQPYSMQLAKKSSKAWLWVLGILGILVLLCGGGFIGFFAWVASQNTSSNSNSIFGNYSQSSPTPGPTASPGDRTSVNKIDLEEWVQQFSIYGTTEYADGEFMMSSKQKGYYYVLAAPDEEEHKTEKATTKVTLRNVDDMPSSLGYGLIFHSDPQPLEQDYAFLIDTKRQKYRVVRHEPSKETSVISWTNSEAINDGSQENTLEVRDLADKIELYINGQLVNSIKNTHGYKGGVTGLYSGDAAKIAFKNLEIRK